PTETGTPKQPGVPDRIESRGLTQQSAPAGTRVAFAPVVQVLDVEGDPVAGAEVEFTIISGGGQLEGIVETTNEAGRTGIYTWRLGVQPGANTLEARVAGASSPVTFTAIGRHVDTP